MAVSRSQISSQMKGGKMGKKPVPAGNKGLKKLPTKVRNKMGYMKKGGAVFKPCKGCPTPTACKKAKKCKKKGK